LIIKSISLMLVVASLAITITTALAQQPLTSPSPSSPPPQQQQNMSTCCSSGSRTHKERRFQQAFHKLSQ
jgi:hypothetical protein